LPLKFVEIKYFFIFSSLKIKTTKGAGMKKYFYLFMLLTFSSLFFIQETFANHLNYTVKKGDNLYTIAKRHNVSVNAIMEHNNLSSNKLAIGDKISIPQQNKPSVKKETVKKTMKTQYLKKSLLFLIPSKFVIM